MVEQYDARRPQAEPARAAGRVVNLAAGQGHPGGGHGHVVRQPGARRRAPRARTRASSAAGVHPVPEAVDREVARLKLESLGVEIDVLTAEQRDYLRSWS